MAIIYTDQEIRQNVWDALSHDARIDPSDIRVTVLDGSVQLDGTVPTYAAKVIAVREAWRIKGVIDVADDLKVRLIRPWSDQEMTDTIRRNLDLDSRIAAPNRIDVSVSRGVVTLSGIVPNEGQRNAAESDAWTVPGVIDITDNVVIAPPSERTDAEIASDVRLVLDEDPGVNASNIRVKVVDRAVDLQGSVPAGTQNQIGRAVDDAWTVPGVRDVMSELTPLARLPAGSDVNLEPWIGFARLMSFLSCLIGIWLVLSPFVLGYSHLIVPTNASMITGGLILLLGVIRYLVGDRAAWASWAIAVLGLWLAVAPAVLGYVGEPVPTTDNVVMGSIAFALGVAGALSTDPEATE